MDVSAYFESLNDEICSLKNRVRGIIEHNHWLSDGQWRESVIKSILRRQLPGSALIGSGFLLFPDKTISTQQDIIIYSSDAPVLFRDGETIIIESAFVCGLIEVKSKLRAFDLEITIKKLSTTINNGHNYRLASGIFCYESDINLQKTRESIQDGSGKANEYQIDWICLGEKNLVHWFDLTPEAPKFEYNQFHHYKFSRSLAFGYFLHNFIEHCTNVLISNHVPISRDWWYPATSKENELIQIFPPKES